MEIKLTNVARASLEELLTDYCDFLRTRGLAQWAKDSKEARELASGKIKPPERNGTKGRSNAAHKLHESNRQVTFETFRYFFDTRPPEILANIVICLIHQTNYLLDRQIKRLEKDFVQEGGLRERMTRAYLEFF